VSQILLVGMESLKLDLIVLVAQVDVRCGMKL
jgi:hypothetical protein